jgi:hypothetical protein
MIVPGLSSQVGTLLLVAVVGGIALRVLKIEVMGKEIVTWLLIGLGLFVAASFLGVL